MPLPSPLPPPPSYHRHDHQLSNNKQTTQLYSVHSWLSEKEQKSCCAVLCWVERENGSILLFSYVVWLLCVRKFKWKGEYKKRGEKWDSLITPKLAYMPRTLFFTAFHLLVFVSLCLLYLFSSSGQSRVKRLHFVYKKILHYIYHTSSMYGKAWCSWWWWDRLFW